MYLRFTDVLFALRERPGQLLTSECALALGAFLFGYKVADRRFAAIHRSLAARLDSGSTFDACTIAYLRHSNTRDAMVSVVELLEEASNQPLETGADSGAPHDLLEYVRLGLEQNRIGMVLGEPTVLWFADCFSGYIAGLDVLGLPLAQEYRGRFQSFEAWLRSTHGTPAAPWHAIVRVHWGPGTKGLKNFMRLWDEFHTPQLVQGR